MTNPETLLEKAKDGFSALGVSEKYTRAAIDHLKRWLTDDMYKDYVP